MEKRDVLHHQALLDGVLQGAGGSQDEGMVEGEEG